MTQAEGRHPAANKERTTRAIAALSHLAAEAELTGDRVAADDYHSLINDHLDTLEEDGFLADPES